MTLSVGCAVEVFVCTFSARKLFDETPRSTCFAVIVLAEEFVLAATSSTATFATVDFAIVTFSSAVFSTTTFSVDTCWAETLSVTTFSDSAFSVVVLSEISFSSCFSTTCTKVRSMVAPSAYSGDHLSCASSLFSMPPKVLSMVVDNRPRDLSPTVYSNPFFSSTLLSTFVTFMDIDTSSPVLGFFQPQSQCRSSCLQLAMLFSPAVGPLFLPAVGPLFWLLVIRVIHLFVFTQPAGLSCTHSPASLLASATVSPHERRTHRLLQCGALVRQGLALSRRAVRPSTC